MTCKTLNGQHELNKGGEFAAMRSQKRFSWTKMANQSEWNNRKHTPFLAANNNGVAHNKLVSGTVVDASDYIRYKKIQAATRSYTRNEIN